MYKALFRKQFLEFFSSLTRDRRKGKTKQRFSLAGFCVVMLLAFASLGFIFFMMASSLADAFFPAGLGWLYYAMMGLIALFLGSLGSVFNTYSGLYLAKDNEMLLSMPIPPSRILLVRMVSVYLIGLMYEVIIMVPTLIAGWTHTSPSALMIVFQILLIFLLGLVILALTCLLGWGVALLSVRMKNRSYLTVIITLAFIAAYYYFYFQANKILQGILANLDTVQKAFKGWAYPFWKYGQAALGDIVAFVFFAAVAIALAAVTWRILSHSFLKIAIRSEVGQNTKKSSFSRKDMVASGFSQALFRKEWKHFTGSAAYMMNCALGTLLMPLAAGFLAIKGKTVLMILQTLPREFNGYIYMGVAAAICTLTTMNDLTAPSVSLEGKSLWILNSLPVPAKIVLRVKQKLHLVLTMIPAWILTAVVLILIKPDLLVSILIVLLVTGFVLLNSAVGLYLNLKRPNLEWTNETAVLKRSIPVTICIFGGWGLMSVIGIGYYLLFSRISITLYLAIWVVLISVAVILVNQWLDKKGSVIFESL